LLLSFAVKGTLQLQCSSFRLSHANQSGMIAKHPPFVQLLSWFYSQTGSSFVFANSICF
jgi:hypothetical protein